MLLTRVLPLIPFIDGDVRGLISTLRGHFVVEAGQYRDTNPPWQRGGHRCPLLMPRLGLYSAKANQELAYGFRHDGILRYAAAPDHHNRLERFQWLTKVLPPL